MNKLLIALCLLSTAASAHGRDNGRGRGHDGHRHDRNNRCEQRCDPSLRHRSAAEVMESHRANLASGDFEAEACNYAEDAVVISDQGVSSGLENILLELQGLSAFFGGQIPMVNQEVIVSVIDNRTEMVRVLFSISVPCIDINDGVDTYIVRDGKIVAQTAHGLPTFTCMP